ncbi:MAG: hypothetical protein JJT77_05075 [Crocinitomicaceae bacterium]|nr:hypothetical protein [Crocinitomicaceae bacterium]
MDSPRRSSWIILLVGLLLGGGIVYFLMAAYNSPRIKTVIQEKEIVETILDTVVLKQKVYIEKTDEYDVSDLNENTPDTDTNLFITDDSLDLDSFEGVEDQEDIIISERLVAKKQIAIQDYAKADTVSVEKILELGSNAFASNIQVEFWESPLELIGYELNRSRLKLYGFNPYESYFLQLTERENQLVLLHKGNTYYLSKTDRFKRLEVR